MHPHVADIEGQIITGGARADHHHTAFFTHEGRDRKGVLPRMFKHQIRVVSLAGDLPNRGAKLAGFFEPICILRGINRRHLSPAVELIAVDHAFGAKPHHKIALAFITDDTNGIGTHHIGQLHRVRAEPTRCPPN